MRRKFVSIIIPTALGREQDLERLLISLSKQTYNNYEVIIVHKGSPEKAQKIIEQTTAMKIKLLREDRGLAAALNLGISNSNGSIIVRTDDDARPVDNWLEELVKTFDLSSRVAGATGPSIVPRKRIKNRDSLLFLYRMINKKDLIYLLMRALYLYVILEKKWHHPGLVTKSGATTWGGAFDEYAKKYDLTPVMFMSPVNMAIRRDVLDKIGFFDEKYEGIGTFCEPDLAFRILESGYIMLYNPRAVVYHLVSRSGIFSSRKNTYYEGYNFIRFIHKNVLPYYGISSLARVALHSLFMTGYWFYLFSKTKRIEALYGIGGALKAIVEGIL